MKVGFWNIRGCGRKNALAEIKDYCIVNKVFVMVVCETKCQSPPTICNISNCGFSQFDFIPTLGLSGGLWIMWKDSSSNPFS